MLKQDKEEDPDQVMVLLVPCMKPLGSHHLYRWDLCANGELGGGKAALTGSRTRPPLTLGVAVQKTQRWTAGSFCRSSGRPRQLTCCHFLHDSLQLVSKSLIMHFMPILPLYHELAVVLAGLT